MIKRVATAMTIVDIQKETGITAARGEDVVAPAAALLVLLDSLSVAVAVAVAPSVSPVPNVSFLSTTSVSPSRETVEESSVESSMITLGLFVVLGRRRVSAGGELEELGQICC